MEIPFLDPLIGLRFEVKIDGDNIGSFNTCEGLGAAIDMQDYHEGGENGFAYKIPGRLTFSPVVLTRALDPAVGSLAPWFTAFQNVPGGGKTGAITVYSGTLLQVAQWNLVDVYPSRWTGPSFGVDGAGVAVETLELVHHGFLPSNGLLPVGG
jgi:phage tail-like protein